MYSVGSPWLARGAVGVLMCAQVGCASDDEPSDSEGEMTAAVETQGAEGTYERDARGMRVIPDEEGFRIDEGEFTVGPHAEGRYCVRIPVPEAWRGQDLVLRGVDANVPLQTHHYFMTYHNEPLDSDVPVPCVGDDAWLPFDENGNGDAGFNGKFLFGAGVGLEEIEAPRTEYGQVLEAGGHFVTDHHVLNFTGDPVDLWAEFNLWVARADQVPHPINTLNCLSEDIEIPPQSQVSVTARCVIPFDLDLVVLGSHAHQHLDLFETRLERDGVLDPEPIYTSTDWDSPKIVDVPPISLKQDDVIQFTCHYTNDSDVTVGYGLGVDAEMCATMNGYAYPAERTFEVPPPLGTIILDNDTDMPMFDTTDLEMPF